MGGMIPRSGVVSLDLDIVYKIEKCGKIRLWSDYNNRTTTTDKTMRQIEKGKYHNLYISKIRQMMLKNPISMAQSLRSSLYGTITVYYDQ